MKKQFVSDPVDVGHGFQVEFRFARGGLYCEWTPDVPGAQQMPLVEGRYLVARDCFIAARLRRLIGKVGPVTTRLEVSSRA